MVNQLEWEAAEKRFKNDIKETIRKSLVPSLNKTITRKGISPFQSAVFQQVTDFKIDSDNNSLSISFQPTAFWNKAEDKLCYRFYMVVDYYTTIKFKDIIKVIENKYSEDDLNNMVTEALNKIEKVMQDTRMIK